MERAVDKITEGVSYKFATGTSRNIGVFIFAVDRLTYLQGNRVDVWSVLVKEKSLQKFEVAAETSIPHVGDVNDIHFWGRDSIAVASSTGAVNIYTLPPPASKKSPSLLSHYQAHERFQGGCSKVKPNPNFSAPFNDTFALNSGSHSYQYRGSSLLSSGYDGSLVVYELEAGRVAHERKGVAAAINDFVWFAPSLTALACSSGQMKLVDLRMRQIKTFLV